MDWLWLLIPICIAVIIDDLYTRWRLSNVLNPVGRLIVTVDDPPLLYLELDDNVDVNNMEELMVTVAYEKDLAK